MSRATEAIGHHAGFLESHQWDIVWQGGVVIRKDPTAQQAGSVNLSREGTGESYNSKPVPAIYCSQADDNRRTRSWI